MQRLENDDKFIITADEAENLLIDGAEYIHNYANPAAGMMIGCDYERAAAIAAFRKAKLIEIGGYGCRGLRHPIVVHEDDGRYTFFEADMDKVRELETARTG